jgi:hypothetical protein
VQKSVLLRELQKEIQRHDLSWRSTITPGVGHGRIAKTSPLKARGRTIPF